MQKTILQKYDSQIVCPKKEVNIRDKNSKGFNWKKKIDNKNNLKCENPE